MFVLFEEDGGFKVGTLMSEADASAQVETPTGKRLKIKRGNILLRFDKPSRDHLLTAAQDIASGLDAGFLWECAPREDFGFDEFAREVFSQTPLPQESAGLLLALHQSPMYFYRKGRGRYRCAPEDALKAALAGAERKRQAAIAQQLMHDEIVAGGMPEDIRAHALTLLVRPDKQSVAFKALESACMALQTIPARLLLARAALPSAYALHRARFLQQCFPLGHHAGHAPDNLAEMVTSFERLPQAAMEAYSIDDATTTEIDDAFSIAPTAEGGWRVGIHIAAPAMAIAPDSPLGRLARERASTVYFPGEKITMLPEAAISAFSLDEGHWRPALSLYVEFDAQGERTGSQSRLEQVRIARNIRLGEWESALEQPLESIDASSLPWHGLKPMLSLARRLRDRREEARGRPEPTGRIDFNFHVDWNPDNPRARQDGDGVPRIETRRRGSAVDVLVSEFMILANTSWGDMLALARLPAIYRVQTMGRVRMQTQPGPHQGLGVANYAWSTSPLRRYSDLVNQWQMLAALGHRPPVFRGNEAELFASVHQFDTLYNQYADFQETMERYWALRWLGLQHGLSDAESWSATDSGITIREKAVALRDGALRLRRAPVLVRCADAPQLVPGVEAEVDLLAADALELGLQARFVSVTSASPIMAIDDEPEASGTRYAVLGDPIHHSRSPWIHARFAEMTGQRMMYEAMRVPAEHLAAELERLAAEGFGGVNLTLPLKEQAFALARAGDWELSERALAAGAINTLRFDSAGVVYADNTDGIGLVRDLERLLGGAGSIVDQRVLLLGAGGAAQGVIGALRAAGVRHVRCANRSFDRVMALTARWAGMDAGSSEWLSGLPMERLAQPIDSRGADPDRDQWRPDDIIINATSASLGGVVLPIHPSWLGGARLALDMMYGPAPTPFMEQARHAGVAHTADGLGMLVEQAAEAFFLWRAQRPETASVLAQLRIQLSAAPSH